jgi:demethylmenaquinone methyltransferase/2-methoxy-6-polyprenyl-1,4-benzoquinol methylase
MFDRIAPRYDLLNRVLSGWRDVAWRRRVATFLKGRADLDLLDLATGTGDQILQLLEAGADLRSAVGVDMAEGMLAVGREKIARRGLARRVTLQTGDATQIPAADSSFDAVTITFGIRNVGDVPRALAEMRRVLRPGGRALILEFSLPGSALLRAAYVFYLRHVLPVVGGWISGDASAYRYLNRTIEAFPYGEAFCALMRDAGFTAVTASPLTLGVATLYKGDT